MPPVFHRYGSEYLSTQEWGALLRRDVRVARVLGAEPVPDARHLLAPLVPPPVPAPLSPPPAVGGGEKGATASVADYSVRLSLHTPRTASEIALLFAIGTLAALEFPRALAHLPSRTGTGERIVPIADAPPDARVLGVSLVWSLPDLLSVGNERELLADLRRFVSETTRLATEHGFTLETPPDPVGAARRAASLYALLRRVGARSELRLAAERGQWASRDVWRTAYSLGLMWGNLDLFHWFGAGESSVFRVLSAGVPPYFLPERAVEGERVPGLVLECDITRLADPVAVFDRMAVALSHMGATLGGRPRTRIGAELDADTLDAERDALGAAVDAMADAGIAPGSDAALRFF